MRMRLLGSLGALLAGAGLAFGQAWSHTPSSTVHQGWSHNAANASRVGPPAACDPCAPLCCAEEPCEQEDKPFDICKRIYISGETLVWWIKDARIDAPLLTTTSDPLTTGILGQPGTTVLFGNNEVEFNAFVGGRLNGGYILNEERTMALEASAFALQEHSDTFSATGDSVSSGIIARPFTDTVAGVGGAALLAFPGGFAGGLTVENTSEMYGMELNFVKNLCRCDCLSLDLLLGARYLALEEDLTITDTFLVLAGGIGFFNGTALPDGNAVIRTDIFETRNRFYGGQIGARLEYRCGCFYALSKLKVALGNNSQEVNIDGTSSLFVSDALAATVPGGLLALSSNIGSSTRDEFTAVPEAAVNIGWHVTPCIRLYAGYTFIYVSDVLRPGDQIDIRVNPGLLPTSPTFGTVSGPATPSVLLRTNDFWAHGMNFGVAFRF